MNKLDQLQRDLAAVFRQHKVDEYSGIPAEALATATTTYCGTLKIAVQAAQKEKGKG